MPSFAIGNVLLKVKHKFLHILYVVLFSIFKSILLYLRLVYSVASCYHFTLLYLYNSKKQSFCFEHMISNIIYCINLFVVSTVCIVLM